MCIMAGRQPNALQQRKFSEENSRTTLYKIRMKSNLTPVLLLRCLPERNRYQTEKYLEKHTLGLVLGSYQAG